ncbi:LysE family translocator [Aquitalea palustris]|uniref:LysE family translocator n=1 Tax=Aquitalea palustris TaxID=2480983 RepID=A0A454JED3_9NEIS|nr:LysE family translocator [Aquitalea palustris]RMC93293.1 LysE family translocator [Aquitalea palustris]
MLEVALLSYVGVMSITPGPNNLMLASSGVNYGFRRTLPHMLGISLGCAAQVFITASLLAWALQWLQAARLPLAVAGCIYLLWLSWKIARSSSPQGVAEGRPMSFIAAALFQWVNPKAWVMVLNAAILFMPADGSQRLSAALLLALIFAVVNLPCISLWAWLGERLRHLLSAARGLLLFNLSMGLLMAATALYLLLDELRHAMPL